MENNFKTSIRPEILEFAKSVLTNEEINEATDLSDCLNDKGKKHDWAVSILQSKICTQPKRPLFYLNHELNYLPEQTRDVVRYAGDYIDQLIKSFASVRRRFKFLSKYLSLGSNIKNAKRVLKPELYEALMSYNKLIYVPAKHEFDYKNRPHLFSGKEAVFILFITKKLANEFINMNNFREKYIDLFQFNEELRKIIESVFNKQPKPKTPKQVFLLYALTKSYKTQAAILLLSERGFGQDAGILSRSIFELAITTLYIVKDDTGKVVERFFDYDWIMRANLYDSVSKDPVLSKNAKFIEGFQKKDSEGDKTEEILKKAEEIKKKYPHIEKNISWSDKSFKQMATEVGRLDAYKTAYYLQCNLSHPNSRNMNDYFYEPEGRLKVNAGPDDDWIPESLVATFDFFIHIIDAWNNEFKFRLEGRLDDLTKRYVKAMQEINTKRNQQDA